MCLAAKNENGLERSQDFLSGGCHVGQDKDSKPQTKNKTNKDVQSSAEKVMVTVLLITTVYCSFKEPRIIINAEQYLDTLKSLRVSLKYKRSGKLTSGVILLHDNT